MLNFIFIACFYATIYSAHITCVCAIYTIVVQSVIYIQIPIGHPSDIYNWLLIYTIYTTADVCAYICIYTITMTHNILLLLIKK